MLHRNQCRVKATNVAYSLQDISGSFLSGAKAARLSQSIAEMDNLGRFLDIFAIAEAHWNTLLLVHGIGTVAQ